MVRIRVYWRYLRRVLGCTGEDLIVLSIVAFIFIGTFIYWINSPIYHTEKAYQRKHAVEFLKQHQWDMDSREINQVLQYYHINLYEIIPWQP